MLEEAASDERGAARVETRHRPPDVARAGDLEAVALDRIGELVRDGGETGTTAAARKRREHETAHPLRMREREAQRDAGAHRQPADDRDRGAGDVEDTTDV